MKTLKIKHLSKKYNGILAVNNISFNVSGGEIIGLLGPNGAGKTTTIKMLTSLLKRSSGKILFNDKEINRDMNNYKKIIGYVPENANLYNHLSGYEYLMFTGLLRKIDKNILGKKIESMSELFQMGTDIHSSIASCSKGTVQKIVIISAIIHNPEILFFDEPLNGLNINMVLIIKELILKLSQAGKIIIYSSHILEIVEKICSRIIIVNKGCLINKKEFEDFKGEKNGRKHFIIVYNFIRRHLRN